MRYKKLGKSDLMVSELCLGCMSFGDPNQGMHSWVLDEDKTTEIIQKALEIGINFFDTAISYQNGTSELYLGRALKKLTQREKVVIATKTPGRSLEDVNSGITIKEHLFKNIDQSLKNLGVDYVDLYILHMWDYNSDLEEVMEAFNELVLLGKTRAIGISNCFAWQLIKANNLAKSKGWAQFVSMQGHYNLLFREEEKEMIPCCKEENIAYTSYSSLASGRLVKDKSEQTKRLLEDTYAANKYDQTAKQDSIIVNRVKEIADKHQWTRTQIALGWLLAKGSVPIVGATSISQLSDIVSSTEIELTNEEITYLEEAYLPHALVGVMSTNKNI